MLIRRIISGGQTGVDRAALDAAIECGIEHGGWCPLGRRAEDGRIPDRYLLAENSSPSYAARTERNVCDSDATLIITAGVLVGGSALTSRFTQQYKRPCWVVELNRTPATDEISAWLQSTGVGVLNIAGPRESQSPGIYERSKTLVLQLLASREA